MRQSQKEDSRPKAVTIVDIAKVAGVGVMTVSRVMKGAKHVSPAMREKVLKVAEEMNYTANVAARTLVTGQTQTIALICGRVSSPYYANLAHHFGLQLAAQGYAMRILHTDEELGFLIDSTHTSAVDGVIVAGLYQSVTKYLQARADTSQPFVFVSEGGSAASDYVQVDLRPAVVQALRAMVAAGRRRIAYVGIGEPEPPHPASAYLPRAAMYCEEMQRAGQAPELIGVDRSVTVDSPARIAALREYFQRNGCPDALFCFHDEIALHVFRALSDLGHRVPEDVMLVGCDDLPFMKFIEPPLSSIAEPTSEVCAAAWLLLKARMASPEAPLQGTVIPARLVVRRSMQA